MSSYVMRFIIFFIIFWMSHFTKYTYHICSYVNYEEIININIKLPNNINTIEIKRKYVLINKLHFSKKKYKPI